MEINEYNNWEPIYYDDDEVTYEETYEETFWQTYIFCMKPTLSQIIPYISKLFLVNILFRVIVKTFVIPKKLCHVTSSVCGIAILYLLIQSSLLYVIVFVTFCMVTVSVTRKVFTTNAAYVISCVFIAYLVGSEFYFPASQIWVETRGLHMVITMKFISLLFDERNGTVKTSPGLIETLGYIFCPSNCVLGPWTSYDIYKNLFEQRMRLLDTSWLKHFLMSFTLAIFFLTLSNCWATWVIPQMFRWTIAYQEALAFRSSNYFVSYLSQATLLTAGFGQTTSKNNFHENCAVSKPTVIELPRSLVQVVVFWNMPMHTWLKTYVFRVTKPLGSFAAIIITYLVSSFLHGCNLKLAAVLLSLGFYTYVEYKFRNKLSHIFDACVKANPCKKCSHKYRSDLYTKCTNVLFSILAIFHLAYLGCLMETDSEMTDVEGDVFYKWRELGYASHIVTGVVYVIYRLI